MALNMLIALSATSLSNMCSCLFVSIELSTVFLACFMEISRLYSGFFVSPQMLLSYPNWSAFDFMSYMKYGYVGLCLNEYEGLVFDCGVSPVVSCVSSGKQVIQKYGYDQYTLNTCKLLCAVSLGDYIVFICFIITNNFIRKL